MLFPSTWRGLRFRDREDAGRHLADELGEFAGDPDALVLALPRGGVPVAYEVARALGAPLDVFLVRKLGVPGHEELAMGAIASGGARVLNQHVVQALRVPAEVIDRVAAGEARELERRERAYRGDRPAPEVRGRDVIVVDDGLATGASMRAAAAALGAREPRRLVIAVPVAAAETCEELKREGYEVVCAVTPEPFHAVGLWYDDFSQTTDDEVRDLLARAREGEGSPARETAEETVRIHAGGVVLEGTLSLPGVMTGVVLFAHGSGSSRHSARNRYVAAELRRAGCGTLLIDLLAEDEEEVDLRTRQLRFDIGLLAERVVAAVDWLVKDRRTRELDIGIFGASTGAAAALVAAATRSGAVGAVVSRGGRPDLAGAALSRVRAPTLLVVGGNDPVVLTLNQQALAALPAEKRLVVVPGATHLFEEPGALERVAGLASGWFAGHLAPADA